MDDLSHFNKRGEVRLSKLVVNLVAVPLCLLIFGVLFLLYSVLPHASKFTDYDLVIYLILVVPLGVVHECIHGFCALYFGGLERKNVKFGAHWKALMLYCHYTSTLTVEAYRIVTLGPLCLTGIPSVVVFFLHPAIWSMLIAGTALGACIGDVWIFLKLRPFGGDLLVKDHPSEIGCDIFERLADQEPQPISAHEDAVDHG